MCWAVCRDACCHLLSCVVTCCSPQSLCCLLSWRDAVMLWRAGPQAGHASGAGLEQAHSGAEHNVCCP